MTTPVPPPQGDAHRQRVLHENLEAAARNTALEQARRVELYPGRWTRRDWAHVSLFATVGALVVALVPGLSHAMRDGGDDAGALVTMSLALPPLTTAQRTAQQVRDDWQLVTVQRGQTLGSIFAELDLPASTMHRILELPDAKAKLTRMRPGTELGFELATDGSLNKLRYDRSDTERVELTVTGDTVAEQVIERPVEVRNVVISGMVGRSLFHSARKLGLSGANINTLTDEVFKYDIDFNTDVTQNDRFSVVVEQVWREGELIRSGPVQAAVFTAKGKPFTAFRFEQDGKAEYYNADGRPLKKSFIRMPIQYARLSSRFGSRRHPVLGTMRMHKGVDYAAPTGTPIMAAGDARVQFRGVQGGYGNTVVLDHGRGHTTLYAHMSRFGNIRQGQRVSQGTVIGYVGTTGLSTGPHLHYEFRVNGVHRNPLQHTMPEPDPLTGPALAQFRQQTGPALARIREVEDLIYADVSATPDPDRQVAAAPRGRPGTRG
ncbi:M23 family metallopeptidase [Luteimonas deserti]|uniref:Peptidoglycan DD-metalloendopeptidase family protein n=1 Tax=Luteimonas deserti TaxID=2752306 RepID=A0A7Z0QNR1_9GAMM|nr:peptidoglycan DD-metalloendopeptidase family protein [Luteimonas deserti]NYZ61991.1 peptidoglycan DD-metalloendopeptidase family protein [Luteimonas deserti]